MNIRQALPALACLLALPFPAAAINVVVDYGYDSSGLFPVGGTARTTLERAAADLSSALTDGQLSALSTASFTGTSGAANATVAWDMSFLAPGTGLQVTIPAILLPADEFRIFVGWRDLSGDTLGEGSTGGANSPDLSTTNSSGDWLGAVDNMEALSNAAMTRGGPTFGTLTGNWGPAGLSLDYGPLIGSLWFDSDRDGNGTTDDLAQLAVGWNLGLDAPGAGQIDFYTVALHEMIHAIGFGGTAAYAALNGDSNLDGSHFLGGTASTRLSDGVSQTAVMTPSIPFGERRELTLIDAEYLSRMGYSAVPEPGAAGLLALLGGLSLARRRR